MDDAQKNVSIRSFGHGVEEAAGDKPAPIHQARRLNSLLRSLDDMRQVEENPLHPGVFLEDFYDLRTVAAANICNHTDTGESISVENGVRFATIHRCIEDAGFVRMLGQVI